jgi:hypothetical protein
MIATLPVQSSENKKIMEPDDTSEELPKSKQGKVVARTDADANQARAMAQYGVPETDIADSLGISKHTLLKLYGADMRAGRSFAKAKIGKTLYQKAVAGDTALLIFYAKTQMGWRETQRIDHTVKAVVQEGKVNLAEISDEELLQYGESSGGDSKKTSS